MTIGVVAVPVFHPACAGDGHRVPGVVHRRARPTGPIPPVRARSGAFPASSRSLARIGGRAVFGVERQTLPSG